MRYVLFAMFLTLSTLASEYIPIGRQTKDNSWLKAEKEALKLAKLEDELRYSRERQAIREEKLFDRIDALAAQPTIRYCTRIGRVRGNERVR